MGLHNHMRLHSGDLFDCSWRGNSKVLTRHIDKRHKEELARQQEGKDDNFQCSECGKFMLSRI